MVVLACASQEIHAGEVGHEARAWAGGDLAGESGLDDLALLENDQPVGERDRFEWVMGDEDSNPGEAGELARKLAADLGADANVERRQGLVEQQQPRLCDEGPQQSDALRLASRQLARHDAGFVAQAGAIQPAARDARPIPLQSKRDVLEHRHVREKDVVLKDDADPSLLGRNVAPHGRIVEHISVELDPPCDWNETRERPQKSRLAGAIGSEHRDGLSGLDGQVDVEAEPAALDLDDRMQAHGAPSPPSTAITRKGIATNVSAMTAAVVVNGIWRPKSWCSGEPISPLRPKASSSATPPTTGGRTIGSVVSARKTPRSVPVVLERTRASGIPSTSATAVAVSEQKRERPSAVAVSVATSSVPT